MSFRTEYSMRSWRSLVLGGLGIVFLSSGVYAWRAISGGSEQPPWALVIPIGFILFGFGLSLSACYAFLRSVRPALEVSDTEIWWERVDQKKVVGRIALEGISEIRFIRGGGELSDSMYALDKRGARHPIPLEYIDGDRCRRAFLEYLAARFPEITINEK